MMPTTAARAFQAFVRSTKKLLSRSSLSFWMVLRTLNFFSKRTRMLGSCAKYYDSCRNHSCLPSGIPVGRKVSTSGLAVAGVAGSPPRYLLPKRLDRDFFEKYDVVVAVILQPEPAGQRARTALRLETELLRRYRLAFRVVGHFHAVHKHNRPRAVERDVHRVPFGPGLTRTR